ncbi:FadR/GntR family transcriptional regulator [Azoarcus sp. KH32C]|uniref:FadR/GntR family transcriptional regulator n=1 Tax=Azoarcus sp. KH32C TaxID=748247 RepID=UPI0002385E8D|nr:FadR/GntR family transcriptional regulator [Azoarcus sp. KH32C]BAL23440.1 transcriptional regulator, GntR family [Azoarcus sp. KH32C]
MALTEKRERAPRLSDEVTRQLEAWINEQKLPSGTQLPTEKVLCERFGVSRAVIREAISRLKADGCVTTRQGSGAYVAARPGQATFRLVRASSPAVDPSLREVSDIFELRYLVETGAAELAARRRTASDLRKMQRALEHMAAALVSGADAVAEDDAFHVAVASATRNPQIERFQVFMGQQFSESRAPTWDAEGHRTGRAREAQIEHERIFAAIAAGDTAAARAAAAAHLEGAAKRLGLNARCWVAAAGPMTAYAPDVDVAEEKQG